VVNSNLGPISQSQRYGHLSLETSH